MTTVPSSRQNFMEELITLVQDREDEVGSRWDGWYQKKGLTRKPKAHEIIRSLRETGRVPDSIYASGNATKKATNTSTGNVEASITNTSQTQNLATDDTKNIVPGKDDFGAIKESNRKWGTLQDAGRRYEEDAAFEREIIETRSIWEPPFYRYLERVTNDDTLEEEQMLEIKRESRAVADYGQFGEEKGTLSRIIGRNWIDQCSAFEDWKESVGIKDGGKLTLRHGGPLAFEEQPSREAVGKTFDTQLGNFRASEAELNSMKDEYRKLIKSGEGTFDHSKFQEMLTKIKQKEKETEKMAEDAVFSHELGEAYDLRDRSNYGV